MLVVSCSGGNEIAKGIAKNLKVPFSELKVQRFPDKEIDFRFTVSVKNRKVILVQTLSPDPDEKLVELLLAIRTAKELGAEKVTVVVPYLAYARQDIRFHSGEVVSNHIISDFIEHAGADEFYTVATHLHRIRSLSEIFLIPSHDVLIHKEMADYVEKKFGKNVVLMGPDEESLRVVKTIANDVGCQYGTFLKKRFSGTKVKNVAFANIDVKGKTVIVVDDMVSTGGTILEAAKHLRKMGAKSVSCLTVHLLLEEVGKKLLRNGIKVVAASNSIPSKFAVIDASKALAASLCVRRR
ncbi:MAG: ribose-phosphate diphosphokinase [Candidatus Micrarchaeota archaeon]